MELTEDDKAFIDLMSYGTSIVKIDHSGKRVHIPLKEFFAEKEYEECRKSLEDRSAK